MTISLTPATGTGGGGSITGPIETEPSIYSQRIINDSFGRQKVANPKTLFDAKMTYGIPILYDQLAVNGATIVHQPDLSGALLSTDTTPGSRAVLQQAQYSLYQPGNGHEAKLTYGNINLPGSCEFNVCYGDDDNGIMVRYVGNDVSLVLRSSSTGSVVETVVPQASWNIDTLGATALNPSGITLDTNARQIFSPDLEWLSVGTVQVGFVIERRFVPVHSFDFANSDGAAYMTTADLPCRWELLGDGINSASVVAECCVVQSFGGDESPTGFPFCTDSGNTLVTVNTTETHLVSIRPKATFGGKVNHVDFNVSDVEAQATSQITEIIIVYNATVTGGAWNSVDTTSAAEVNNTATGFSGGTKIKAFSVSASSGGQGSPGSGSKEISSKLPFTVHLDGSQDVITVIAKTSTGTSDTKATINWEEVQ